jgi:anti-sigma factor RsiW
MTEHPDMQALSAYLDGESDPLESRCIATHLAVCPRCATVVRDLQAISQGLRALVPEQPPVDLTARVSVLLDSPRPTRQRPARWPKRLPVVAGAAASLLFGVLIGSALPPEPPASAALSLNALAVLGSAPPGALCARPESCYLKVTLK